MLWAASGTTASGYSVIESLPPGPSEVGTVTPTLQAKEVWAEVQCLVGVSGSDGGIETTYGCPEPADAAVTPSHQRTVKLCPVSTPYRPHVEVATGHHVSTAIEM